MSKTLGISAARHAAIFGPKDEIWGSEAGRTRHCKVCEGWHRLDEPWPHNCRPATRQMQHLPAPQVISDIAPHVEGGVYIDSRQTQREFMKQNGLVEFEPFTETAGTHKQDFGKDYEKELVQDIKRSLQEDPLNRPPPQMIEEANEKANTEEQISTENMEVIGDERTTTP